MWFSLTPGFNDTHRPDTVVLSDLANWLDTQYRQGTQLAGIIYFHRITDVRMEGSAMRNLKMFRKLCGKKPMKNVAIASTFWDALDQTKAISHEEELKAKSDFWRDMISHGATVKRFLGTKESAWDILMHFSQKTTVTLDIQLELVDQNKRLGETAAGIVVSEDLHRLEEKYVTMIEGMKKETAIALEERDTKMQDILKKDRERMDQKLALVHEDQELLRRERRDEIRRLEEENQIRSAHLRKEYEDKLQEIKDQFDQVRIQDEMDRETSNANRRPAVKILKVVGTGAYEPTTLPKLLDALEDLTKQY